MSSTKHRTAAIAEIAASLKNANELLEKIHLLDEWVESCLESFPDAPGPATPPPPTEPSRPVQGTDATTEPTRPNPRRGLTDHLRVILDEVKKSGEAGTTSREISESLKGSDTEIAPKAVGNALQRLKREGLIAKLGGGRTSRWKVPVPESGSESLSLLSGDHEA